MVGLGEIEGRENTTVCEIIYKVLDESNGVSVRNLLDLATKWAVGRFAYTQR